MNMDNCLSDTKEITSDAEPPNWYHGRHMDNVKYTAVIAELVALASKHTGLKAFYRQGGQRYDEMDGCDAAEAYDVGYNPDPTVGSIFSATPLGTDMSPFWKELERLELLIKTPLDEPIMTDDQMVIGGYWYVVDGKSSECDWFKNDENSGITVAEYKRRFGWNEIRRCDVYGRINRQVEKPEFPLQDRIPTDQLPNRWSKSGRHINQSARRRRNSNKIKKVL